MAKTEEVEKRNCKAVLSIIDYFQGLIQPLDMTRYDLPSAGGMHITRLMAMQKLVTDGTPSKIAQAVLCKVNAREILITELSTIFGCSQAEARSLVNTTDFLYGRLFKKVIVAMSPDDLQRQIDHVMLSPQGAVIRFYKQQKVDSYRAQDLVGGKPKPAAKPISSKLVATPPQLHYSGGNAESVTRTMERQELKDLDAGMKRVLVDPMTVLSDEETANVATTHLSIKHVVENCYALSSEINGQIKARISDLRRSCVEDVEKEVRGTRNNPRAFNREDWERNSKKFTESDVLPNLALEFVKRIAGGPSLPRIEFFRELLKSEEVKLRRMAAVKAELRSLTSQ